MANPEKGEVSFEVDGKTYTLRLTWNEIAKFEAVQGVAWFDGFSHKLLQPMSISGGEWIALLWAALQRHHKDVTIFEAGDLLTEIGLERAAGIITDCLTYTFPPPSVEENPQ